MAGRQADLGLIAKYGLGLEDRDETGWLGRLSRRRRRAMGRRPTTVRRGDTTLAFSLAISDTVCSL